MDVALIQLCSELNYKNNLRKIQAFIDKVKRESPSVKAIFLPEVFYSMSNGVRPTPYLVESENEHFYHIQNLAKENKVYLVGGSAATRVGDKVFNTAYNFAPDGTELGSYAKQHLFSLSLRGESSIELDESRVYCAGTENKMIRLEEFRLGLSICFDLRFPELYREYFSKGANVLSVGSAFTIPTGRAHWEILLRARAIENQSYVIAANQWGTHNPKVKTYGHSMVIDPWGDIIAQMGEGEGYIVAKLSQERIDKVRARMNVRPKVK